MNNIVVLVEHRKGKVRDISYELLSFACGLAEKNNASVSAVIIADDPEKMAADISGYAHSIICAAHSEFSNFDQESYQDILLAVIEDLKPVLTVMGYTSTGIDLAPSLAVRGNMPLVQDCIGVELTGDGLVSHRKVYNGKVNEKILSLSEKGYIVTLQPGIYEKGDWNLDSKIETKASLQPRTDKLRKFIEYIEAETGSVDITQSDIIVSVGRGIKEKENIPMVQELADAIGGVVACSRPIVDAGWLEKNRQVGSSGKTVKPKFYIALGISGSSYHQMGMKGADNIIAVNKDPNAPIFNIADFGIVDDIFKVIPVLKKKIAEIKGI